jgi:hypothetical protein
VDPRAGLDDVEKKTKDNQKVRNLILSLKPSKLNLLSVQI